MSKPVSYSPDQGTSQLSDRGDSVAAMQHLRGLHKDLRTLAQHAGQQGWQVHRTSGGHLKWVSPTGDVVVSASTPSERRGMRNLKALLRARGFQHT